MVVGSVATSRKKGRKVPLRKQRYSTSVRSEKIQEMLTVGKFALQAIYCLPKSKRFFNTTRQQKVHSCQFLVYICDINEALMSHINFFETFSFKDITLEQKSN